MEKLTNRTCPVAFTGQLIGMRWMATILRDLFLHKTRRYQDFQNSQKGISPNTLSDRLKMLEANEIIEREIYQDHPPRAQYKLTNKGRDLGPILLAMKDWGEKHKSS